MLPPKSSKELIDQIEAKSKKAADGEDVNVDDILAELDSIKSEDSSLLSRFEIASNMGQGGTKTFYPNKASFQSMLKTYNRNELKKIQEQSGASQMTSDEFITALTTEAFN